MAADRRGLPRVLLVHHALNVTWLLRNGLRELGCKADTAYFDFGGPSRDLTWDCDVSLPASIIGTPAVAAFFASALFRYDVFHFWAEPYLIPALYRPWTRQLPWDLQLLRRAGKTIVFQSDGCFRMVRPSVWKRDIDPEICQVCQTTQGDTYGFCSNLNTQKVSLHMSRLAQARIGIGTGLDFEADADFRFMPVDMDLWRPDIEIPEEHRYVRRQPGSVLIFHSVADHIIGNRGNIKGTSYVHQAIASLQEEGLNVELIEARRVPHKTVRFYQAQADIVVDQLFIGGGGANARECLALGKPVLTRLHDGQRSRLIGREGDLIPFVPVDRHTVLDELRRLVVDQKARQAIGAASHRFAVENLAPTACAASYLQLYQDARR